MCSCSQVSSWPSSSRPSLVGASRSSATATAGRTVVILILGLAAGTLSAPGLESRSYVQAGLVIVAFLFAVLALATGSLAALTLLVVSILGLVATSMARHLRHRGGTPVAT